LIRALSEFAGRDLESERILPSGPPGETRNSANCTLSPSRPPDAQTIKAPPLKSTSQIVHRGSFRSLQGSQAPAKERPPARHFYTFDNHLVSGSSSFNAEIGRNSVVDISILKPTLRG
jgi:hypothetical protein